LYLAKLKPDGILAFNVTNRYLDLKPVLADLAGATQPALVCYAFDDDKVTEEQANAGKLPSYWVVMARRSADLGGLQDDLINWHRQYARPGVRVWSDDFANIFGVLKWQ